MFKFNTVKLLVVSLLSASAMQVTAADFPPAENSATIKPAESTNQADSNWIDFSDPTAIYSKAGLATGTEGVDVYASLSGYLGGQFEQKLTVESIHDMDYYKINYLAFNNTNDTGFTLNSRWDNDYDEVSVGIIKKLQFEQGQIVHLYPSMRFGIMWDFDDAISTTTFVELDAALRYNVNRNFWLGVTPNYRYALNGENIKDLDATVDVGYQLAEEVAVSIHGNNDDEVWADFTLAF